MAQDNTKRDQQDQNRPEGYQDPNEQDSLESRDGTSDLEQQSREGRAQNQGAGAESDLDRDSEDLDEMDDDRDDDMREGGANRRRSIN